MSLEAATATQTLRAHQALCQELLQLVEAESQALRQPPADSGCAQTLAFEAERRRRAWLPQLNELQDQLRRHRLWWQSLTPEQRSGHPGVDALVRINQDLVMRVVLLDRENETIRLRLGVQTVTPSSPAPPAAPRPHYVSRLYRQFTSQQS